MQILVFVLAEMLIKHEVNTYFANLIYNLDKPFPAAVHNYARGPALIPNHIERWQDSVNLNIIVKLCNSLYIINHVTLISKFGKQESWNQAKIPQRFGITLKKICSVGPLVIMLIIDTYLYHINLDSGYLYSKQ